MNYFFDSYAILEIINQNENYLKYSDQIIVTNSLHLAEVYYRILLEYNKQTADFWIRNLKFKLIDIDADISIEAARFRFENKKKKLSYADCIGYISSIKNNLKFLTGDKEFENFVNVEFVKK